MAGRRRGPRDDVSAERLLAAADQVLVANGCAGLTLRAIARAADVTPNAIYTYFDGLLALRNDLGDAFLGTLDLDLLTLGTPRQAFTTFVAHLRERFVTAPGYAELLASQPIAGPNAVDLNEALLEFLTGPGGHDLDQARELTLLITEWLHGTLSLMVNTAPATARSFDDAFARLDLSGHPLTAGRTGANDPLLRIGLLADIVVGRD